MVDLFTKEFKGRSREYYASAFQAGRLRVEETAMTARRVAAKRAADGVGPAELKDTPLRDGQRIRHLVHRHEPPVLAGRVVVLSVTRDVAAVCKPASMPVHPTGQYRKNSVQGILACEEAHSLGRLWPVHRLDRNVSGLLLFARSSAAANALRLQITAGAVVKEYVALVAGEWPAGLPTLVDAPLRYDYGCRRSVCGSAPSAKRAATAFVLLARCGSTSLVAARPLTGRTHQIRAHAQHAGFPIANDGCYGGVAAPAASPHRGGEFEGPRDALCTHCPWLAPQGQAEDQLDVEALFLHATRYSSQGWSFEAPLPEWAAAAMPGGALPQGLWDDLPAHALSIVAGEGE